MKRGLIKAAFFVALFFASAGVAHAVTIRMKTSDWRVGEKSIWTVIYVSDSNWLNGTNFYTVHVGT